LSRGGPCGPQLPFPSGPAKRMDGHARIGKAGEGTGSACMGARCHAAAAPSGRHHDSATEIAGRPAARLHKLADRGQESSEGLRPHCRLTTCADDEHRRRPGRCGGEQSADTGRLLRRARIDAFSRSPSDRSPHCVAVTHSLVSYQKRRTAGAPDDRQMGTAGERVRTCTSPWWTPSE